MQAKGQTGRHAGWLSRELMAKIKVTAGVLCYLLQACWRWLKGSLTTNKTKERNWGTRQSNFLDCNHLPFVLMGKHHAVQRKYIK